MTHAMVQKPVCKERPARPTAAVIPVFITGHPVITKWGNYSIF